MFCPENQTLPVIWVDDGLTPCSSDIISWSVVLASIVILGGGQSLLYLKNSQLKSVLHARSRLASLQLALQTLLTVLPIPSLLAVVYGTSQNGTFFGFQIMTCLFKGEMILPYHFIFILRYQSQGSGCTPIEEFLHFSLRLVWKAAGVLLHSTNQICVMVSRCHRFKKCHIM